MRRLLDRTKLRVAALALGGVLVLGGCDPNVRTTVLGGVEAASTGLLTAFISAFFQSLDVPAEDPNQATTVMRPVEARATSIA